MQRKAPQVQVLIVSGESRTVSHRANEHRHGELEDENFIVQAA